MGHGVLSTLTERDPLAPEELYARPKPAGR
jgi:hypothetical protein